MKFAIAILYFGYLCVLDVNAQFFGGNQDGTSSSFLQQNICPELIASVYTGGDELGDNHSLLIQNSCVYGFIPIAIGGDGNGSNKNELMQTNCTLVATDNISFGGDADGSASNELMQLDCALVVYNSSLGGDADGSANSELMQSDCVLVATDNISLGGEADGSANNELMQLDCALLAPDNISVGGDADGFAVNELMQMNCAVVLPGNVSFGGLADGFAVNKLIQMNCALIVPGNVSFGGIADGFAYSKFQQNNCIVVPIKLLFFNVSCTNNQVRFKWATASESDNSHFEILQSVDGVNFMKVATIPGAGNSSSITDYAYAIDGALSSVLFYKLVQVDLSGRNSSSTVVRTNCNAESSVVIFPNPASNQITIERSESTPNVLIIIDAIGKKVIEKRLLGQVNTVNLQRLSGGIYTIQLINNGSLFSQKILIER